MKTPPLTKAMRTVKLTTGAALAALLAFATLATLAASAPARAASDDDAIAMRVVPGGFENRLQNARFEPQQNGALAGWQPFGSGFALAPGAGREGRNAIVVERREGEAARGISQEIALDQKSPVPLLVSGWSRAQNVSGAPDTDYSLYADIIYQDGTNLWGQAAPFRTGTHGWQRVEFFIQPDKAIRSIQIYALFRGQHTGRAWFSDISLAVLGARSGMAVFDGVPVKVAQKRAASKNVSVGNAASNATTYATRDGLALRMTSGGGRVASLKIGGREVADASAPSGFMARDVAANSHYFSFAGGRCAALKLALDVRARAAADHIAIEGRLADASGRDRAVSLAFALPMDARGWRWGRDIRTEERVGEVENSTTAICNSGANGRLSLYPLANIHDARSGLAIALDMNHPAQYRLACNAATRQFFIVYDFGLAPEKNSAAFRFIIYRTDPRWGFRAAAERLYKIFPEQFRVRDANRKQGIWMPFSDIGKVEGWRDFGFRYKEGDDRIAWDDRVGVLTFRYTEPATWWMPMPPDAPRTYEAAVSQMQRIAAAPKHPQHAQAQSVLTSGFHDEDGKYRLIFRNEPWANGAVWSLNPNPALPGAITEANSKWNAKLRDRLYRNSPKGQLDGEYLDSLEGYVTADLNFNRAHFKHATTPLTFSTDEHRPALHKALMIYEFTRAMSRDVHEIGRLMMANAVPYRFSFLAPWLDVMGTETNWLRDGRYAPDDDAAMNLRRTMSAAKPYLLLQNTDFNRFDFPLVERYMQRCLFYGMFPGFFSADAATNPYWQDSKWYNRDRPLFKKYIAVIRAVAEAGWQPVTLARSDNAGAWLERFGKPGGPLYLTVRNNSTGPQRARIRLEKPLALAAPPVNALSGESLALSDGAVVVSLQPDETMAIRLR